ncbi:Eukaryotic translation initiation factor isoform 4E-2 [Hibiscus syriacus]|uniref:Eukaryotic translation initiation factor isoform 4E n=1 Tax=Hibiscus syriacus TaxID=106335 RepID=A0A6A3CG54_HIBSY|nr:Eukaryotic translation initiation factor isoform 4E-2 [Hibiscus syriacus]
MASAAAEVNAVPEEVVAEKQPHKLDRKWTFWFDKESSLSKAPLGVLLYAKFTLLTPLKNFGVCMIKYSSRASCPREMLISLVQGWSRTQMEDPECANGGKWTVISNGKANLETMWLETLMALIGEQFDESDEICGVVASVRQRQNKLALWTKTSTNEAAQDDSRKEDRQRPIQCLNIFVFSNFGFEFG